MKIVRVVAPARVHFGVLNPFGTARGRKYLCVGLGVKEPKTIVEIEFPGRGEINPEIPEVKDVLNRLWYVYEIDVDKVNIRIVSHAPRHVGLGSTTQLKLSVALGVCNAYGRNVDVVELAKVLGRGQVSGVGTYVFKYGGLVIDSGKTSENSFPSLLLRIQFPEDWHVLIVIPEGSRGPDEVEEQVLFASSCDPALVYYAHFVLFNRLVPSVIDREFEEFANALEELQVTVGKMFSNVQQGVFRKETANIVELLKRLGARGVGQSSWGPAAYCFDVNKKFLQEIAEKLRKEGYECIMTEPDNVGAKVFIISR